MSLGVANGSGGQSAQAAMSIKAVVTNSALTSRSFSLRGATNNAGATVYATNLKFTLREIESTGT